MMSPIQLHCERTRSSPHSVWRHSPARTVSFMAIFHSTAGWHFFAAAAAAFESNWRCTFECGTFARLNEKGQKDAPGEKRPTTHRQCQRLSFFKFLRNIDSVCRLCWANGEFCRTGLTRGWRKDSHCSMMAFVLECWSLSRKRFHIRQWTATFAIEIRFPPVYLLHSAEVDFNELFSFFKI